LFDEMKGVLKANSSRVTTLHSNSRRHPSSNPKAMARIIRKFYAAIWKSRGEKPSAEELRTYLLDYEGSYPAHLKPKLPSSDELIKLINGSGNSSAGPDGVPFSILRYSADELGPLLSEMIKWLAKGKQAPKNFNSGDLHLLKKNFSSLIRDTRPITVGNSLNRILAKSIAQAITPALIELLMGNQKGFIPTRKGEDHIVDITQRYYSSLSKKKQRFLLFLDTKKAFDSVDHEFIIGVLEAAKIPIEIINVIMGLLSNIEVYPTLGEALGPIFINRGVKQGCPLSPLLFALCFDVLLRKLSKIHNNKSYAFADDLVVLTKNSKVIVEILYSIETFSHFSGLGLNLGKTHILTTLNPSLRDIATLRRGGFKEIKLVTQAVYLGVLMGQKVTRLDIFKPVLEKFTNRLALLNPRLRPASLNKRINTFNIYLLSLFSYLAQFYLIPYKQIVQKVRNLCRSHIIA
jgi:hypothetical protein